MRDIQKERFCDGCFHLNSPEDHPNTKSHRCEKYDCQVLHIGFHPHLCRLEECEQKDGKEFIRFNRYTALTLKYSGCP